jgi:RNA polymerase primary sigma factor
MQAYQENKQTTTESEYPGEEYLLAKAADQGFVTYDDVLIAFPQVEENLEELEAVLAALMEDGIEIGAPERWEREDGDEQPDQVEELPDLSARFDMIALDDTIGLYLKEIGQRPLLTGEQEATLAKCMEAGRIALRRLGDVSDAEEKARLRQAVADGLTAREHLVCANFRLVVSIAKKYIGRGVPFLDLIQEGNIGLMRAANKFDYRLELKFSTYATWWIRQAVTRAIADQSRTIRVPVHMGDQINKLLRVTHQLTQELGHEPSSEELAVALDIPRDKVEEMLKVAHLPISLEMPVDDAEESELGDFVEDEGNIAPDDVVASAMLKQLLTDILHDLPPREARILRMRYGLVDGETYTLEEVGKKLGVTRERIRQIEAQALRRLRHPAYSRRLQSFVR